LTDIEILDGFRVIHMDTLRESYPHKFEPSGAMDYRWFETQIRPYNFVYVRHDKNSLSFTLQKGPVHTHGVNGCQVDTIIATVSEIVRGLNVRLPCKENDDCLRHLSLALVSLKKRKIDRENRKVEGKNLL